jgi:hypothetical protein
MPTPWKSMGESGQRGVVLEVGRRGDGSLRSLLESQGFQVLSCAGPSAERPCPLVTQRGCPLVSHADGILFELPLTDPAHREVLDAYRHVPRDRLPIQIVPTAAAPDGESWKRTFRGFTASVVELAHRRRSAARPYDPPPPD